MVSERQGRARALQGSGATGQECAAWVVVVAVAGLLASERPVHFGKRVVRLGSGLAGCGLTEAGAPVGAGTSLTTGWSRLRYRARKQPRHALPVSFLAKVVSRTRAAAQPVRWAFRLNLREH